MATTCRSKLFCACFDISITALSLLPQAQIVCLLGYEHTKQAQQAQNFNKHISYFSLFLKQLRGSGLIFVSQDRI